MPIPIPKSEPRSKTALQRHYEVEKALADRLRHASKTERQTLYSEVYDDLFRQITDLPKAVDNPNAQQHLVNLKTDALRPFLSCESEFLEVGAGDCALALNVAGIVKKVHAIEASVEALGALETPDNFNLLISDSIALPLDNATIDVAYSCHFIEHLHPADARDHAAEIYRVLRPGGIYQCITPNRLWGPHDISRYFDDVPTGFHLREYTHSDLAGLLHEAGFRDSKVIRGIGQQSTQTSLWPYRFVEGLLDLLPVYLRRRVMDRFLRGMQKPFRPMEQVMVVTRR